MLMSLEQYLATVGIADHFRFESPNDQERIRQCYRTYQERYMREPVNDRSVRREKFRTGYNVKLIDNDKLAGEPYYMVPDNVKIDADDYHQIQGKLYLTVDEIEMLSQHGRDHRLFLVEVMKQLNGGVS